MPPVCRVKLGMGKSDRLNPWQGDKRH